jgi:hypothetical protein
MRIAQRGVTLRHPNAMECQVWRKKVERTEAPGALLGGLPTLGGIGVTDNEDEPQVSYELLGDGKVLFTGRYEGTTLEDNKASAETVTGVALIEPLQDKAFVPKDSDLVMILLAGAVIPYEVTNVLNTVNIPPYVAKYELSPQGDLLFDAGVGVA